MSVPSSCICQSDQSRLPRAPWLSCIVAALVDLLDIDGPVLHRLEGVASSRSLRALASDRRGGGPRRISYCGLSCFVHRTQYGVEPTRCPLDGTCGMGCENLRQKPQARWLNKSRLDIGLAATTGATARGRPRSSWSTRASKLGKPSTHTPTNVKRCVSTLALAWVAPTAKSTQPFIKR